MNIKRSYFQLLMGSVTVGLFLANCTVKTVSDDCEDGSTSSDCKKSSSSTAGKSSGTTTNVEGQACAKGETNSGCECPGKVTGYQECNSKGVFGGCICPDSTSTGGTGNDPEGGTSGTTYTAGTTSTGGTGTVSPAEGGAPTEGGSGAGGAPPTFVPTDPTDCEACLEVLCPTELEACIGDAVTDDTCAQQYSDIMRCIDGERAAGNGVVKRDVVRSCGVTVGASSAPDPTFPDWAPPVMDDRTTALINCMATSSTDPAGPNADWANKSSNFPASGPKVWPAESCAKLSCTSAF